MSGEHTRACCAPRADRAAHGSARGAGAPARAATRTKGLTGLCGGRFAMGSESPAINEGDGEAPVRTRTVGAFFISPTAVTNAQFAAFVNATGHVTDAEREGWSLVFAPFVSHRTARHVTEVVADAPWWAKVPGATWKHPEGPDSSMRDRQNHPVVHVSWHDAVAYCRWRAVRLPTEQEWEYAARGGLEGRDFPWGDELAPDGVHRCNIWQGRFPVHNTGDDGYVGTAPVKAYRANGYGLFNMVGNAWEWCQDPLEADGSPGPPHDAIAAPLRGGSYLCHASYCNRYRVSARTWNTLDSSSGHVGFRCVADPPGIPGGLEQPLEQKTSDVY